LASSCAKVVAFALRVSVSVSRCIEALNGLERDPFPSNDVRIMMLAHLALSAGALCFVRNALGFAQLIFTALIWRCRAHFRQTPQANSRRVAQIWPIATHLGHPSRVFMKPSPCPRTVITFSRTRQKVKARLQPITIGKINFT